MCIMKHVPCGHCFSLNGYRNLNPNTVWQGILIPCQKVLGLLSTGQRRNRLGTVCIRANSKLLLKPGRFCWLTCSQRHRYVITCAFANSKIKYKCQIDNIQSKYHTDRQCIGDIFFLDYRCGHDFNLDNDIICPSCTIQ